MSMPIEFSAKAPTENSPLRCSSIASIATWQFDIIEGIKIEIDDGLPGRWRCRGGFLARLRTSWRNRPARREARRQRHANVEVWSVYRLAVDSGPGETPYVPLTGAISGLPLGVAASVATFGAAASRHGAFSVT
jgi:hypothetical protein